MHPLLPGNEGIKPKLLRMKTKSIHLIDAFPCQTELAAACCQKRGRVVTRLREKSLSVKTGEPPHLVIDAPSELTLAAPLGAKRRVDFVASLSYNALESFDEH
jgi:hypothetical protein